MSSRIILRGLVDNFFEMIWRVFLSLGKLKSSPRSAIEFRCLWGNDRVEIEFSHITL